MPPAAALALEAHRPALTGHCYRMLGSVMDADDAVQETFLRAWKNLDRFEERSAVRTWLTRIATNVCLDTLEREGRRRRLRPVELGTPPAVPQGLTSLPTRPHEEWVEPIPESAVVPTDASPEERFILRESVRLAFVAALQYLPPRQRAVLLLTQVLNWSAVETAEGLDMTVAAVNSALQRARATLAARNPAVMPRELDAAQLATVARYVEAFEAYDVDALTRLLHEEATLSMPPYDMWITGHEHIGYWFRNQGIGCRGSRLVPVQANGPVAFAHYRDGGRTPWALVVLDLDGDRITAQTSYLDVQTLFPRFGLPLALPS